MVDPNPGVSMQEPDGSRERGNAEASYSTGEAAGGSAIGGGVELSGKNEAPSAIGGGADLGGGNGGHATAPKGHRNEVVTMLEANTILNERVHETIVQAQKRTINKVLGEMAWKGSQHLEIPLCHLKQSHWVCSAYDLNMAIYTSFTKERELYPWYLELWRQMPSSPFELNLYLKCHPGTFGGSGDASKIEMRFILSRPKTNEWRTQLKTLLPHLILQQLLIPQILLPLLVQPRLLEIYEDVEETSQHSIRRRINAFFPSLPTATEDDLQELSSLASHKQVRTLSPTGSVGNVEILIGDYFQLSNNVS
ncbi:hypothetical protein SELMODRAFT_424576 [Selaginella moellendorffii]|uniref:Uncharacterized protein n=1 Tax=Selaginella moellendorffii TaxID=88036 RepID=D8SQC7_SELML|nr:hypothetical protein SELMODRAFT_424576 [Selaginella moellendorffii]